MADRVGSDVPAAFHQYLFQRASRLRDYVQRKIPQRFITSIFPEDILQEVWFQAYRGFPHFQPDGPDSLDRWLTTLTDNELIDAIRTAERVRRALGDDRCIVTIDAADCDSDPGVLAPSPERSPVQEAAGQEAIAIVRDAIRGLPEDARRLITLSHFEGRSLDEIADLLGRPVNPVRHQLGEARRALRRRLGRAGRFFTDFVSEEAPIHPEARNP